MNKYYLNRLSIVPIRKEPSHKSEMINQILFGEIGTLTNKQENWIKVALEHDKYEGWVDEKQLINVNTIDNNYKIIKSPFLQKMIDEKMIFLPMGSKIENAHIAKFKEDELLENETIDFNNIVPSALAFLGTPYLWGGRTIWGIDCSGFVQTIFGGNGYQLPRDAYQQQEVGIEVDFEDADKNDLAFFANKEGKIVHVGLILDNKKRIIHASGEVRIDTLDKNGILVSGEKKYSHVLHSIKRVIYQ